MRRIRRRAAVDPAAATPLFVAENADRPMGPDSLDDAWKAGVMTTSISQSLHLLSRFGTLWWLPRQGIGNGLDDLGWAPILDVDGDQVAELLEAFRAAEVPAYAARAYPAVEELTASPDQPRLMRLWVGTSCYSRAQDVLLTRMPQHREPL
jgi:hypothetical protein